MYRFRKSDSRRMVKITPAMALELLEKYNVYGGQRNIKLQWLAYLKQQLVDGLFIKGWIVFADLPDGTRVLVNGQHQLTACVQTGIPFHADMDYYDADTPDDVWLLYSKIDAARPRSEQDVMKAAKQVFKSEALRNIDNTTLSNCGTALKFLADGVEPNFHVKRYGKEEKVLLVQEYEDDVLFVKSMLVDSQCKRTTPAITAAMIACRRVSAKASYFWVRVLGGHDLEKNSPEWRLHKEMQQGMSIPQKMIGSLRHARQWNLAIAWWNSFITGTDRQYVRLDSLKSPIAIIGDVRLPRRPRGRPRKETTA